MPTALGIVGWALIALGVIAIILGLIFGAREALRKQAEPGAQAALPTAFLEVLKELLGAPRDKFFFIGGLLLIILGLALNGVIVFSTATGTPTEAIGGA